MYATVMDAHAISRTCLCVRARAFCLLTYHQTPVRCRIDPLSSIWTGGYERLDNAFLLFNYNSFGVSVMEDEGSFADHLSGVAATDGTWHHIAGAARVAGIPLSSAMTTDERLLPTVKNAAVLRALRYS